MKSEVKDTPELRFPEFVGGWKEQRLCNVADFLDGRRIPLKEAVRAKIRGAYPYYGASGIIDYVNDFIFDDELILLAEDGENILSRALPIAFRVSGKCWVNNHAHVIKPKDETSIDFLCHYLANISYVEYNTGTAQPKLNQEVCKRILLRLPTVPEQRKISAFLSAVDEKIAQIAWKKDLLLKYKKGVIQQIFDQKIRFKDQAGKDFPNWEVKRLRDNTVWASGGTPAKDVKEYWNGDIPWISGSTMRGSKYSDSDLRITSKGLQNGSRLAPTGSLLILVRGSMLHKSVPVGMAVRDLAFNQDVKSIMCTNDLSAHFLLYLLIYSQNRLLNMVASTGIGAGKIELADLKNMLVSIPTPDEQKKISDFLSALEEKIDLVGQQLQLTRNFKKGLLQQMFV
jgi:type I restriction enzyme, S subunit